MTAVYITAAILLTYFVVRYLYPYLYDLYVLNKAIKTLEKELDLTTLSKEDAILIEDCISKMKEIKKQLRLWD